ncbi:PulJ/GspJ family protein [Acidovorax sp. BL-A-41-H1]|uniref:PulJ/GspJ family protein n=1 Tax=Acidovorax sp. BL-A-41-H1 TaxID=3421102 RepID=UPI003F7936F7
MRIENGQRGLTLLELLVAFAIMALSLGMLYRIMGGASAAHGISNDTNVQPY